MEPQAAALDWTAGGFDAQGVVMEPQAVAFDSDPAAFEPQSSVPQPQQSCRGTWGTMPEVPDLFGGRTPRRQECRSAWRPSGGTAAGGQ
jgi:hypothetical protein